MFCFSVFRLALIFYGMKIVHNYSLFSQRKTLYEVFLKDKYAVCTQGRHQTILNGGEGADFFSDKVHIAFVDLPHEGKQWLSEFYIVLPIDIHVIFLTRK